MFPAPFSTLHMTGHCSTTLNASDVVRSDARSPEQGCRRVGWALECELVIQADESEEMGMMMLLSTCVHRDWGKERLWPSETPHFGHWLLSQACSHPSVTSGTIFSQQTCSFSSDYSSLYPSFHLSVPEETIHS